MQENADNDKKKQTKKTREGYPVSLKKKKKSTRMLH